MAQTRSDARRLLNACARGELVQPVPQVFVLPEMWNRLEAREREARRVKALARLHPNWVFSDVSAAALHGLEVPNMLFGDVHLACARKENSHGRRGVRRHIMADAQVQLVEGVRVTSVVRTAFDCMCAYDFSWSLAIADSALRISGMSRADMMASFKRIRTSKDKRKALEIMELANPLAANGGESVARATMIKLGFMMPILQYKISDPVNGWNNYYVDFYWQLPAGNVAGELDGRDKYVDSNMTGGRDVLAVLADERLRESRLTGADVKVMRFSYADVMRPRKLADLMTAFGIPSGFDVPRVALS